MSECADFWSDLGLPRIGARDVHRLFHKVTRLALILASTSPIRQQLLANAGVAARCAAPDCDEAAVKREHRGDPSGLALTLAKRKALSLADSADDLVIGADSVVAIASGRLKARKSVSGSGRRTRNGSAISRVIVRVTGADSSTESRIAITSRIAAAIAVAVS